MSDSQQRNLPLWTVVLLGGLGIPYFLWGGLPGGRPASQQVGSPSGSDGGMGSLRRPDLTYLQPLSDMWRIRPSEKSDLDPEELRDGLAKHTNVYALIVCLPDPVDTSVTHQFDQIVEAVQRAAERQSFVLDRYYFPWEERRSKTRGKVPQPEYPEDKKTTDQAEAKSKPLPTHPNTPGMLLFRSTRSSSEQRQLPDILCVFLVPETATWGIDKAAFATCLDFICFAMPLRKETTVYCVGPYFSGSQSSFQYTVSLWSKLRVLRAFASALGLSGLPYGQGSFIAASAGFLGGDKPRYSSHISLSVISGSTSAIKPCAFEDHINKAAINCQCTFRTTVHSDDAIARAITDYILKERKPIQGLPRVALLVESNTQFGENVRATFEKLGKNEGKIFVKSYAFPLNISDLRYEQLKQTESANAGSLTKNLFTSRRSILYETEGGRDTEPSFAPATDGVLRERIVDQILTEVAKDRAHFIGVAATDVKDTLFLMERIRRSCPDAVLFTPWVDQLFLDPGVAPFMRGVLVASTYPLASWTSAVTFPFPKATDLRVRFSDHTCQGYYNATSLQLNAMLPMTADSERDTGQAKKLYLLDYGPPFESHCKSVSKK